MFEVRGKCVICAQRYVTNNISALYCGHIFHYDCILQWFRCSHTCPTCRAYSSSNQIVKHLFFDDPDEHNDSSLLSASPNSQRRELLLAEEAVRELKNSLHSKEEEIRSLKRSYDCLKIIALRESLKNAELTAQKSSLSNENALLKTKNKEMERTLETTKRRLQACEFYKIVTTGDGEIALDTFVTDEGSLRLQSFFTFQKKQLLEARSLQSKLREDLRQEREQLRASKKKEIELENHLKSLERELRDLHAIWEKPLKERLRPRNNASNCRSVEKSRENTDSETLPKRKTRRPLVDRKNGSQEDANFVDSKEEEQEATT